MDLLEQPYFQDILVCSSYSVFESPSLMIDLPMLILLPKSAMMLQIVKRNRENETLTWEELLTREMFNLTGQLVNPYMQKYLVKKNCFGWHKKRKNISKALIRNTHKNNLNKVLHSWFKIERCEGVLKARYEIGHFGILGVIFCLGGGVSNVCLMLLFQCCCVLFREIWDLHLNLCFTSQEKKRDTECGIFTQNTVCMHLALCKSMHTVSLWWELLFVIYIY